MPTRGAADWRYLRGRTKESPYAAAFFVLCEELGVLPDGQAQRGADVRVLNPRSAGH